jgi:hypothetical protein
LSPRRALDCYEARVRTARELYRATCKNSADLPDFQRMAANDAAFTALKSAQQDAMREFIASEFAELFNLREHFSSQGRR